MVSIIVGKKKDSRLYGYEKDYRYLARIEGHNAAMRGRSVLEAVGNLVVQYQELCRLRIEVVPDEE